MWRLFRRKQQGFFIEVGALDGIRLSNTFFFEQKGWDGICFEPHPSFYKALQRNRPGSLCIEAAAGREESRLTFYAEPRGEFSTLMRENLDNEILRGKMVDYEEITVKVLPLNKVLSDIDSSIPIDFVSIDVEGAEASVLEGISLKKYSPRCLIIEANGELMNNKIDGIMKMNGYHKAGRLSKTNNFYCQNFFDAIRLALIPIRCAVFVNNNKPLGEAASDGQSSIKEIKLPCLFFIGLTQFAHRIIRRFSSAIASHTIRTPIK